MKLPKPDDWIEQSPCYWLEWKAYEDGVGRYEFMLPRESRCHKEWLRGWDAAALADPETPDWLSNDDLSWVDL